MSKLKVPTRIKNYVISVLRRGTYKWPEKSKAFKNAQVQVGEFSTGRPKFMYSCSICGKLFARKDVVADHILPVVPIEGYASGLEFDATEYIIRLYCDASGLQIICEEDHKIKTMLENQLRKEYKSAKLEEKEND